MPETHTSDGVLHLAGFLILGLLAWLAAWAHGFEAHRRAASVLAGLGAYAAIDELTQPLVRRHAAWGDWAADLIGAAVAVIVAELLLRLRSPRQADG